MKILIVFEDEKHTVTRSSNLILGSPHILLHIIKMMVVFFNLLLCFLYLQNIFSPRSETVCIVVLLALALHQGFNAEVPT